MGGEIKIKFDSADGTWFNGGERHERCHCLPFKATVNEMQEGERGGGKGKFRLTRLPNRQGGRWVHHERPRL